MLRSHKISQITKYPHDSAAAPVTIGEQIQDSTCCSEFRVKFSGIYNTWYSLSLHQPSYDLFSALEQSSCESVKAQTPSRLTRAAGRVPSGNGAWQGQYSKH